jgi:hypothetical protein
MTIAIPAMLGAIKKMLEWNDAPPSGATVHHGRLKTTAIKK